jgi:hypothetical protein
VRLRVSLTYLGELVPCRRVVVEEVSPTSYVGDVEIFWIVRNDVSDLIAKGEVEQDVSSVEILLSAWLDEVGQKRNSKTAAE